MDNATITANLNNAECIKSSTRFGETAYYNICTGAHQVVPWGGVDWLGFVAVVALVLVFLFMMIVMLID